MTTVIDELVVRLGLDNKEFKKRSGETKRDLEKTRKEGDKTARGLQTALRTIGGIAAGKMLVNWAGDIISTNASLSRMAANLGTSATALSSWGRSVEISGGDASGFQATVRNLSRALTEFKMTGTSGILPYLQMLGVGIADANGKALPFEQLLKNIGEALRRLPSRADAANIASAMGIDEGTFNLLMKGNEEVDKLIAKQREIGGMNDSNYQQLERINSKWREMSASVKATSDRIVSDLAPAIESVMDEVIDVNAAFDKSGGVVKTVKDQWGEFVKVSPLGKMIDKVLPSANASVGPVKRSGGVSAAILAAQVQAESGGNPRAVNKGDIRVTGSPSLGLAQFQPATAKQYGIDPMDPDQARRGQSMYMNDLFKQFGSVQKALAAYNWGPGNLQKTIKAHGDDWMAHIPKSTREYVDKIEKSAPNMTIGQISVYSQATDAKGVARDIRGELAAQFDYGMN